MPFLIKFYWIKYLILAIEFMLPFFIAVKGRYIRIFISFIYFVIVCVQLGSIYYIGQFLPEVAIGNFMFINDLGVLPYYLICACVLSYLLLFKYVSLKFSSIKISNICLIISLIIIIIYPKSCIKQLYNELYNTYLVNFSTKLSSKERAFVVKKLTKDYVVKDSNVSKYIEPKRYNVIVFFFESFSKNTLLQDLMPNIYNLEKNSIDVINYYNHTAPTLRGLRGQLASMYQYSSAYLNKRGTFNYAAQVEKLQDFDHKRYIEKRYNVNDFKSIANILNKEGYNTYFQTTVRTDDSELESDFYKVFTYMGFKKVYGYEDYKNPNKGKSGLEDDDSFNLLLENLNHIKEPFFYGIYTVGTHVGRDVGEGHGIKYKDGKNSYLNVYHNLDYQFEQFFKKFINSKLSDNTILIITADHSAFIEPKFKKTFNPKTDVYIDQIPLIIYKKGITPRVVDAKNLNSLSLAPTILDILGITKATNMFLGSSIFDSAPKKECNYISALGPDKYKVIDGNITNITKDKKYKKVVDEIDLYQKFGGYY